MEIDPIGFTDDVSADDAPSGATLARRDRLNTYVAITRPRSSSGTTDCSIPFASAPLMSIVKPRQNRRAAASMVELTSAKLQVDPHKVTPGDPVRLTLAIPTSVKKGKSTIRTDVLAKTSKVVIRYNH